MCVLFWSKKKETHVATASLSFTISISYKFDTPFERDLKREVFKIVGRTKGFGTLGWYFRMSFYLCIFFYLQYMWVKHGSSWKLAILYGISQAMIGLNVQHDANHGSISRRPWVNEFFGLCADLIGSNKWLWQAQHWTHHAYTNHPEKDPDTLSVEPWMVVNAYPMGHPSRKWVHNFQAFYFLFLFAGYLLSVLISPDILDLRHRGALGVGIQLENSYIKSRRKYAICLRILYFYLNVLTPFLHHGLLWEAFGHVMLMGISGSLTLAIPFSLSHNFENSDRDPTGSVNRTGPVCWFKSQVETSCSYGGFLSGYFTGGLNFQIEHHLFPRMCSSWYPYIAPTVREVCMKHGVRYVYYPWVWQNLFSTLKYIHVAGKAKEV